MKEIVMTMTSKGQVTIPAEVRRHLGITKNQKIALVIEKTGEVKLKVPRYPSLDVVVGKAGRLDRPLDWQKVRSVARADHLRGKVTKRHA